MKQKQKLSVSYTLLLTLALTVAVSPSLLAGQSQTQRSRVQPSTTPSGPVPAPTVSPAFPTPTPVTAPTPTIVPSSPIPGTVAPTRSVAELQSRISEILRKPEIASAMVGIKIASLDTGRVLFEENSTKLLRPASNMKIYTIATALDRLSPDFRFNTSVYAKARPNAAGVIVGDLTIYGRGDPSIAARFNNGDYFKGIQDLAAKIAAAGVKRVEGDLVGDESYFVGPQYGSGWQWEDLTWYFGAEITSLTINDNALDLFVKPGPSIGSVANITTGPPDPLLAIVNQVTTAAKGTRRNISVYRGLGENKIVISGSIPIDDKGYSGGIGISHPALLFVYLLRSELNKKGVVVTGKSRISSSPGVTVDTTSSTTSAPVTTQVEVASMQSPPLSVVAAQTLKPSQNLYTELILRTLGKMVPPAPDQPPRQTSEDQGIEIVKGFLKTVGIRPESLALSDGSGLSRDDMITAEASVELLTFMSKHRYSDVFRNALPIAGVDGTLRTRLRNTAAENNLRAKTGSLSSAASLAGYVTSAAGERLAFSIMVNNYAPGVEPRSLCIDPIAVLIASFEGRSQ